MAVGDSPGGGLINIYHIKASEAALLSVSVSRSAPCFNWIIHHHH